MDDLIATPSLVDLSLERIRSGQYRMLDPRLQEFADRLVAAERDAARYRWLRDVGDETWMPLIRRNPKASHDEAMVIDAAIDAAMKEKP